MWFWAGAIQADAEPGSEICLECHDGYDLSLSEGPHVADGDVERAATCISCHADTGTHTEDPTEDNIFNPAKRMSWEVDQVCSKCHQPHMNSGVDGFDAHVGAELSCISCHRIHDVKYGLTAGNDACTQCHVGVAKDFLKRSNHPLGEGIVRCVDCHDFLGERGPNFGHGIQANCQSCHPEQAGPFLFEHETAGSFSTEGEGCTACHNPHGSPNDRLLTQTGDLLCRQCHVEGRQHTNTAHSGQFAGMSCIDCHNHVHGSFEPQNRFLLDPSLGSFVGGSLSSCFCHNQY